MHPKASKDQKAVVCYLDIEIGDQDENQRQAQGFKVAQAFLQSVKNQVNVCYQARERMDDERIINFVFPPPPPFDTPYLLIPCICDTHTQLLEYFLFLYTIDAVWLV